MDEASVVSLEKTFHLRVRRQADPGAVPYVEEFDVPLRPNMNVVSALMELRKNPVTATGERTTPVVWDCSCLEEVCGACAMVINGRARQACSALVHTLSKPVTLEPLRKFPVIRDLEVDRGMMFEHLKRVKAWIELDGTHSLGPGPRISQDLQAWSYELQRCMTCGCCMDACPQVTGRSDFMGPAALAQVQLLNAHPLGESLKHDRLRAAMGRGGIVDCGKAQNCERVCPKGLPLTKALGELGRDTTVHGILGWLGR